MLSLQNFSRFHSRRPRAAGRRRGFTLVEILTATTIMSLIVALVMSIMSQVLSAWNRSSDDLALGESASKVFQIVSQDLQAAIFRSDGSQWLSLTTEVPASCPVSTANVSRLIFYTSTPMRQSVDGGTAGSPGQPIPGDICAVEYRVVYADPFGNASSTHRSFQLHRVVVDSATTFSGINKQPLMGIGQNSSGSATTLWQAFDNLVDKTEAVSSQVATSQGKSFNTSIYGSSTTQSLLQENVAQFNVFLYFYGYSPDVGGAAPAIQAYPMTQFKNISPPVYYFGGEPKGGTTNPSFLDSANDPSHPPAFVALAYADITVTVLTDDGAALLQQYSGAIPPDFNWNQFLQQYGRTYTQRVRFYNKPH